MTRNRFLLALSAGLVLSAVSAAAIVSSTITYQGSLKQSGVPVNGTYTIELDVTDSSGTACWLGTPQSVTVTEGLYRMDIAPTFDNCPNTDLYIRTKINGSTLSPSEKITSAPFALVARSVSAGSVTEGDLSVNGKLNVGAGGNYTASVSTSGAFLANDGTRSAPAFSFLSDRGTGIYRAGAGGLWWVSNGIGQFGFNGGEVAFGVNANPNISGGVSLGQSGAGWKAIYTGNGSASAPSYSFADETNTGMYKIQPGCMFWSSFGVNQFGFNGTQVAFMVPANPNVDAALSLGASGARWSDVWAVNLHQTSSSRTKNLIRQLTVAGGKVGLSSIASDSIRPATGVAITSRQKDGKTIDDAVSSGQPETFSVPRAIVFRWKKDQGTPRDQDVIGFLGDDLPLEAHAIRDDGSRDPEVFDTGAVIGILCAEVRDLETRLTALEKSSAGRMQ